MTTHPNDPAVRADNKCARPGCNKPRRMPKRPVTKDVPISVYERDPFCSSTCCREFNGCPVDEHAHTCKGCGCDVNEQTDGCQQCASRHESRRRWNRQLDVAFA